MRISRGVVVVCVVWALCVGCGDGVEVPDEVRRAQVDNYRETTGTDRLTEVVDELNGG